jgi:hypothetical protein
MDLFVTKSVAKIGGPVSPAESASSEVTHLERTGSGFSLIYRIPRVALSERSRLAPSSLHARSTRPLALEVPRPVPITSQPLVESAFVGRPVA